ncbi:hypothetical protein BC939DRAFT_449196 [Gamsiella multidivaricata]|uniref:uncharacterized protein n=1 Tax=Gamsiella multidivaricata TaxID=101098 RepID=UPI0022205C26|nr:uncharacterized protein BC939DRAFT_449196 [Gamsiella multidivaricata]KAG0370316.1 hypothetical protein BGZ54_006892 [Gamsiella multidivaricata]KAI7824769.1 hypothetical protein BC939DRAFT_449196 [Gamsiella multidivaricata]
MSPSNVLPTVTKASTDALAEAAKSTNSTFQLLYFPLHGRGELIRDILAYSGAKWEELPVDWPVQKPQTPFRVVPIVYEHTSSGTILELAESNAIERYLALKFNLLGSNIWEEHLVNRYYYSTDVLYQGFVPRVAAAKPEVRAEEAKKFYEEVLSKWITIHEEHLRQNGDNGHYVGHRVTLADLKTVSVINRILLLVPKGVEAPLSAELTPSLWKVKQNAESHPSLAAWKQSQRSQELDSNTKARFGF